MGRIAGEKRGAECPFCGAIATPVTIGGYDTDNRRIRQRRCEECRHMFVTVEAPVMLEDGRPIPYSWLDEHYRHVQREQKRKYHTRKTGSGFRGIKTKPAIEGVATIDVTVKVKVPASMRVDTAHGTAPEVPNFKEDVATYQLTPIEDRIAIAKAYEAGATVNELALQYRVSTRSVQRHIARHGRRAA
jgi:hypothetical protein